MYFIVTHNWFFFKLQGQLKQSLMTGLVPEVTYHPKLDVLYDFGEIQQNTSIVTAHFPTQHIAYENVQQGDFSYSVQLEQSVCHNGYTKILANRVYKKGAFTDSYLKDIHGDLRCALFVSGKAENVPTMSFVGCPEWPSVAKEWVSRKRYQNWPPPPVVTAIQNDGCILVPGSHTSSLNPEIEWKYCFGKAEITLFQQATSEHQRYCFMIFKFFCREIFANTEMSALDIAQSTFFFACEVLPQEQWQTSPGPCIWYMIRKLENDVKSKLIPNYFIPKNNMIDYCTDFVSMEEKISQIATQPMVYFTKLQEALNMNPCGSNLIQQLKEELGHFQNERTTALQTFIPAQMKSARRSIKAMHFDIGFDLLNESYQQRLSVITCSDSLPYTVFLVGALSGLDLSSSVWFALYAERKLQGQLSRPLVLDLCSDLKMKSIGEVLPSDVAGSYATALVPESFFVQFDAFCHDYAAFLVKTGTISEALPILYLCHSRYQEFRKTTGCTVPNQQESALICDENMLNVYAGIFALHYRQGQQQIFVELLDDALGVVTRINKVYAFTWLFGVYELAAGKEGLKQLIQRIGNKPAPNHQDVSLLNTLLAWPKRFIL